MRLHDLEEIELRNQRNPNEDVTTLLKEVRSLWQAKFTKDDLANWQVEMMTEYDLPAGVARKATAFLEDKLEAEGVMA